MQREARIDQNSDTPPQFAVIAVQKCSLEGTAGGATVHAWLGRGFGYLLPPVRPLGRADTRGGRRRRHHCGRGKTRFSPRPRDERRLDRLRECASAATTGRSVTCTSARSSRVRRSSSFPATFKGATHARPFTPVGEMTSSDPRVFAEAPAPTARPATAKQRSAHGVLFCC
jgi:hypothetical protein